jgi:hypothetical protein
VVAVLVALLSSGELVLVVWEVWLVEMLGWVQAVAVAVVELLEVMAVTDMFALFTGVQTNGSYTNVFRFGNYR